MTGVRKFLLKISPKVRPIVIVACFGLSLVVLFVWVRSFTVGDNFRTKTRNVLGTLTNLRIRTGEGLLALQIDRFDFSANPQAAEGFAQSYDARNRYGAPGYSPRRPEPPMQIIYPRQTSVLGSLGFQWYRTHDLFRGANHAFYTFAAPFWAIFFLTIAYPLTRYIAGVVKRQREDRIALGLCPTCGTPMSPDQSRCPGCDKPLVLARQT